MASIARAPRMDLGYARPIASALGRPAYTLAALRLVLEAMRSFFLPQLENALFRRRGVVNVDHPLDATIPFEPGYVKKYLEFIKLWMGSFYTIGRIYGPAAEAGLVAYVDRIRALYADAGRVYRELHTTTTRPAKNYNLRFAVIHAMDPHLNCIPSLHVLIVTANWLLAEDLLSRLPPLNGGKATSRGFDPSAYVEALRGEALAITESVLFVKQHSVNCVGASLYCLERFFPGFVGDRAESFVRDLFADGRSLAPEPAEALRGRMREVRDALAASYAARPQRGWRAPVLEFIESYAAAGRAAKGRPRA
jgi:hypothetical protein